MKVIIPAKSISNRVPHKNFRPFYQNKSLLDIKIEQVLTAFDPKDIYLSCDDPTFQNIASTYGIEFILRNKKFATEDIPWPKAFMGIISELHVADDEDIFWVEVVNPLFKDFVEFKETWVEKKKEGFDSMVLVSSIKKFLFHSNGHPANFLYGPWHTYSQELTPYYAWDSVCVMQKSDMHYFEYPIGRKPHFFITDSPSIDIDTMEEFNIASILYAKIQGY